MKITVTEEHIKHGIVRSVYNCPIALALKDCTRDEHAYAGVIDFKVCNNYYAPPEKALDFIQAFDSGEFVVPFEFELGEPKVFASV